MIKFEGVVYPMFWFCALLPICWRRGWLRKSILWKSVLAAVICLLPYVWYRLIKPVPYPLSSWWQAIFASPSSVLACYPRALFLYIFGRFFNSEFFHWLLKDNIHLQWDGKWIGLNSLVNEQLAVLPWLLLVLLAFSVWKKREWPALLCLTLTMLGMFAFLSFVISCLSYTQSDTPNVADFSCAFTFYGSGGMGRYFYPFFTAWFLGIAALWFDDPQPSPSAATPNPPRDNPPSRRAKPSKKTATTCLFAASPLNSGYEERRDARQIRGILPANSGCALFVGNDQKVFVINVEPQMGAIIGMFLKQTPKERPLTHDLINRIFQGFGINVERVVITDLKNSTYFARLILQQQNEVARKIVELDARPSDCLAIAAAQKKPIFVSNALFEQVEDMSEVLNRINETGGETE